MKQLKIKEALGSASLTRASAPELEGANANQPPPFEGRNLYLTDRALRSAAEREGAAWARERLEAWGAVTGSAETYALAARANRFGPELETHDRFGNRIDEVVFDPAWHLLMASAMREGEHCSPWAEPRAGAQAARAAAGGQDICADRHGHDRAPGRVRRARQYNPRNLLKRRRVSPHRAQVVF